MNKKKTISFSQRIAAHKRTRHAHTNTQKQTLPPYAEFSFGKKKNSKNLLEKKMEKKLDSYQNFDRIKSNVCECFGQFSFATIFQMTLPQTHSCCCCCTHTQWDIIFPDATLWKFAKNNNN